MFKIALGEGENQFMKIKQFFSSFLSVFGKKRSVLHDVSVLRRSIVRLKAKGDTQAMLEATMKLSRLLLDQGEHKEANVLLRDAASVAAKSKFEAEHAEVRIELANLAKADGDMTSACEHWQIALQLYHDLNRKEDRDQIAQCMKECGCPSGWFLNSF
ncbi:MAG: hypothetical protein ACKOW3_09500 [Hyphomicrobium sp.]